MNDRRETKKGNVRRPIITRPGRWQPVILFPTTHTYSSTAIHVHHTSIVGVWEKRAAQKLVHGDA